MQGDNNDYLYGVPPQHQPLNWKADPPRPQWPKPEIKRRADSADLKQNAQTSWRWFLGWLAFCTTVTLAGLALIWFCNHIMAARDVKLNEAYPQRLQAERSWQRLCNPDLVPRCSELNENTASARVCLDGVKEAVETRLPENVRHDCEALAIARSRNVENDALGWALNEVCAHTPLVRMLCSPCVFDTAARESPWTWWFLQALTTSRNLTMLGGALFALNLGWPVLLSLYLVASKRVKEAEKLVVYGAAPPEGMVPGVALGMMMNKKLE